MSNKVLFVCSNNTHVKMFRETGKYLADLAPYFLSLDGIYGEGASRELAQAGLEARTLGLSRSRVARNNKEIILYGYPWLFQELKALLEEWQPGVIVLGNDRGIAEKYIIYRAKQMGLKTVLVQDGILPLEGLLKQGAKQEPKQEPEQEPKQGLKQRLKQYVGQALQAMGKPYLAPNGYGFGGTDAFAVIGATTAAYYRQNGCPAELLVVGQPRYDGYPRRDFQPLGAKTELTVCYFSSAIRRYYGDELHEQLIGEIKELDNCLKTKIFKGKTVRFLVKLHPRESVNDYVSLGFPAEQLITGIDNLDFIPSIDIAVSSFSTSLLETVLMGKISWITNFKFDHPVLNKLIPAYLGLPILSTSSELQARLERVAEDPGYALNQFAEVKQAVDNYLLSGPIPAAKLLAEEISLRIRE